MVDIDREILDHLVEHGPLDVVQLAEELDEHPVTVDRCCYELQQEGFLRLVGEGRYAMTVEAERRL